MDETHIDLFYELVKDGKTLRCVEQELLAVGCDLSRFSEVTLLKNMLCVIRDQPTTWGS